MPILMPICAHPSTFLLGGGTPRCSVCFADMEVSGGPVGRRQPSWTWPSQLHPDDWSAEMIVDWFHKHDIGNQQQSCDGFEFCRNNLVQPATYGYVWVELTLDLDYKMAWLLDVRKHDGHEETRRHLFVTTGDIYAEFPTPTRFADDSLSRVSQGILWFSGRVNEWFRSERERCTDTGCCCNDGDCDTTGVCGNDHSLTGDT